MTQQSQLGAKNGSCEAKPNSIKRAEMDTAKPRRQCRSGVFSRKPSAIALPSAIYSVQIIALPQGEGKGPERRGTRADNVGFWLIRRAYLEVNVANK